MKLRDGAPPVVLLAAPRWTQLAEVEEAFSKMTALPTEPQSVRVTTALKPEEIQADVRASFGRFRVCYEDLLTRTPGAAGTSNVGFAIQPDGRVAEIAIDPGSTLREPAFDACMSAGFAALRFPGAGVRTTVKYPVSFSP